MPVPPPFVVVAVGATVAVVEPVGVTEPLVVGENAELGIEVRIEKPSEAGADRLVNAIGGFIEYGGPLILVDSGTATTFDVVGEDGAFEGGVIAQMNSSWTTRVYRDDLVTFHADGTHGSAVAGLHDCMIQPRAATPRPVWNPDQRQTLDFHGTWAAVPDNQPFDNGFKEQWEMFIRHVCEDAPYKFTLLEGAKGVQLAECALQSWRERRWIDVAPIKL